MNRRPNRPRLLSASIAPRRIVLSPPISPEIRWHREAAPAHRQVRASTLRLLLHSGHPFPDQVSGSSVALSADPPGGHGCVRQDRAPANAQTGFPLRPSPTPRSKALPTKRKIGLALKASPAMSAFNHVCLAIVAAHQARSRITARSAIHALLECPLACSCTYISSVVVPRIGSSDRSKPPSRLTAVIRA